MNRKKKIKEKVEKQINNNWDLLKRDDPENVAQFINNIIDRTWQGDDEGIIEPM